MKIKYSPSHVAEIDMIKMTGNSWLYFGFWVGERDLTVSQNELTEVFHLKKCWPSNFETVFATFCFYKISDRSNLRKDLFWLREYQSIIAEKAW